MSGLFGGGGNTTTTSVSPILGSVQIQTSAYGRAIPWVFGTARVPANLIWYGDFTPIAHTTTQTSGGGSGGKGGGAPTSTQTTTTYTYTAAMLLQLCRGVISGVGTVWRDKEKTSLSELGLSLYTGTSSQTPFPHLTTNHPSEALAYRDISYVASAALDLGDNASLGNHSFEVQGLNPFGGGIVDANPKDVVTYIAAELGIASRLGDLTAFSNYCVANGIFVAPVYLEQRAAFDAILALAKIGNSEVVPSEDKIKLVPFSDEPASGNGATYTPDTTPIFVFGDDDFLAEPGEDPVQFEDQDEDVQVSDAYNIVKVKITNRAKDYNVDVIEAQDDDHIAIYGRLPMDEPIDLQEIVDPAVGRLVAQNILQNGLYFRAAYTFKLGPGKADLLEPMDVIAINRPSLGLVAHPVRIREISELAEGQKEGWSLRVREYPSGAGAGVLYPTEAGTGYGVNFNVVPGSVNPPVILDAPAVVTDSGFELWMAVSGSTANWGGCQVWVATDSGGPYKKVGTIFGPGRHGAVYSATFPAGADPDTVNTCHVDLTVSKGTLTGGTAADADNRNTLCWIEGELFSFETADLTASFKYDLKDYLRRGVYNTPVAAHPIGERFVRLDQALFRYAYEADLVGQTLYVKLPSFNIFGAAPEDISSVPAYTHVIAGPIGAPDAPTGFTVQQIGAVLNFKVDPIAYLQLDRVEIRFADPGETMWDNGVPVTNILRGNTDSNGSTPPGTWRFMARAYDLAGNPSQTFAMYDMTVTSDTFIIIRQRQDAPDWLGTLSNFVLHWTGVIVPQGQLAAGTYAGNEWIDEFCPDAYPTCTYTAPEIDKGIDATARIWADIVSTLGPGEGGTSSPNHKIDFRTSAGAYDGFENWTIGNVNFRYLKSQLVLDTAVGKARISGFRTVIDKEPVTEEKRGLSIGATGLAVAFDAKFHLQPAITPFNDGVTPLIPVHTADSLTGTTLHLYNTSAVEVGGIGGYRANGV